MAHNAVVDHYRGSRPTTPIDETFDIEDETQSLTQPIEASVDRAELQLAIKRLNPDQQQVFVLRFVEGMSHAEVGKILGKSEGAVRVIQHRALHVMQRFLKALPGEAYA